ncbi:hypothetical protein AAMO2058_000229900 [Amorphochlora amoebiformis]
MSTFDLMNSKGGDITPIPSNTPINTPMKPDGGRNLDISEEDLQEMDQDSGDGDKSLSVEVPRYFRFFDETSKCEYYYDVVTKETTWDPPPEGSLIVNDTEFNDIEEESRNSSGDRKQFPKPPTSRRPSRIFERRLSKLEISEGKKGQRDSEGDTILHREVREYHPERVRELLNVEEIIKSLEEFDHSSAETQRSAGNRVLIPLGFLGLAAVGLIMSLLCTGEKGIDDKVFEPFFTFFGDLASSSETR